MPRETAAPKASISNRRPTEGDLLTFMVRPKMERGQEGGWEKFFGWVDEGATPLRQAQGEVLRTAGGTPTLLGTGEDTTILRHENGEFHDPGVSAGRLRNSLGNR